MPRKSTTRNPFGTILEKTVTVKGKPRKVWDARKRFPVTLPDGTKTYKDVTRRCYSKTEAQAALLAMPKEVEEKREAVRKQITDAADRTFRDLADYYLATYCKPAVIARGRVVSGLRQNTGPIRSQVERFAEHFGDAKLASITYEDIRALAEEIAVTPIKPNLGSVRATKLPEVSTVNRKLALLRRMLNIGVRLRWIAVNPFREGDPLINASAESQRDRVLSFDEESRLLAQCEAPFHYKTTFRAEKPFTMRLSNPWKHMKLIVIMAIDTGLRAGEMMALKWTMVDFARRVIELPPEITKGWKARTVPMSSRLIAELEIHRAAQVARKKSPLVFGGMKSCRRAFAGLCAAAGIEGLHFHDLRHTATTWFDDAGVSGAQKMNIVGHSSDAVHQRYNNPSDDVLETVRAKIDAHEAKRRSTARGNEIR